MYTHSLIHKHTNTSIPKRSFNLENPIEIFLCIKLFFILTLRKKYLYSEFFWSVFSRIRTEYAEISLRIQYECRKTRTRKSPNMDTFHAV